MVVCAACSEEDGSGRGSGGGAASGNRQPPGVGQRQVAAAAAGRGRQPRQGRLRLHVQASVSPAEGGLPSLPRGAGQSAHPGQWYLLVLLAQCDAPDVTPSFMHAPQAAA